MLADLDQLVEEGLASINAAASKDDLEAARVALLGRKGRLRAMQSGLGKVDPADRPAIGKKFNEVKNALEGAIKEAQGKLAGAGGGAKVKKKVDVTLPGRRPPLGRRHPITQTTDELVEIFARLGFTVGYGPEVEDVWHNFEALNTPLEHPARDPRDNFYINPEMLLRTQTSTVQIRIMEQTKPPLRVVVPGRVYRPDSVDATHSFMFHQMEGLWVEEGVTFADLKTVMTQFLKLLYGDDIRLRFRPHFFPFTEPSAEVDIGWGLTGDDWMEIAGCGMVDPHVLQAVGYDPDEVTGLAFGIGIERLVMRRYGIKDIRLLYENDVRFLEQF